MKWRPKVKPSVGDRRVVSRFALLPVTINGETRWLEWVDILQELQEVESRFGDSAGYCTWTELKFVNVEFLCLPYR